MTAGRTRNRIGIIGFASNSGLGTLSWEFARHLLPERVLLAKTRYAEFPHRFPKSRRGLTAENVEWLLSGIDVLLMFETPGGDWDVLRLAKKRGVRTVMIPMFECMPVPWPALPDLVICPSKLDLKIFRDELSCKVLYVPVPVDRERVRFHQRSRALVFEHHAGHGGLYGRNGTHELLAAVPMLKSDARILIYTQRAIEFSHPKVEVRVGNYEHYWELWGKGDVFVFPHKFDGLSLPIQEALSSGMPVLSTAIAPFVGWLPNEWMFPAVERTEMRVFQRFVDVAVVDPADVARKIDEWHDRDITADSALANRLAAKLDWRRLLDEYLKILSQL